METKKCIKCEETKEISEFPIRKYPNGNICYRGECKRCVKVRQDKYQKEHQEEIKQWHIEYYQQNKERLKLKNDIWWDNNREKMNQHRKNKRKKEISPEIPEINEADIYKNLI